MQWTLPIAKKYDADVNKFRTTIVEGLLARLGMELEEAKIRAKSISIFYLGLIEFHFNQEPRVEEKKEIQKTVLKMFWPEVLSKTSNGKIGNRFIQGKKALSGSPLYYHRRKEGCNQ